MTQTDRKPGVVATIADQVYALRPDIEMNGVLIKMDEATLRVHFPYKRINVDIEYHEVPDLYSVKVHRLRGIADVDTATYEGIYWDQLGDLLP